jgi:hypothetical protein
MLAHLYNQSLKQYIEAAEQDRSGEPELRYTILHGTVDIKILRSAEHSLKHKTDTKSLLELRFPLRDIYFRS